MNRLIAWTVSGRTAVGCVVFLLARPVPADETGIAGPAGTPTNGATGIVLLVEDQSDAVAPDQKSARAETVAPGTRWSVENPIFLSRLAGKDISEAYSEDFGTFSFSKKPPEGYRLIVVRFDLTANVADADALDKLASVRMAQSNAYPFVGTSFSVGDRDRERLGGVCQFLDIASFSLTNAARIVFRPSWIILPEEARGSYILDGGGHQPMFGKDPSRTPWRKTCLTSAGFTGLLDVGRTVRIHLLFAIPRDAVFDDMRLQIADQRGIPLAMER